MADHARFTIDTGIQVYFCDPKSPWQRGTNRNTNGLLRQYLPRTIDLRSYRQADFDAIADRTQRPPSTNPRLQDTIASTHRGVALTA